MITLASCGYDCVEKDTGMHKSCETMKESVDKKVFKFEMIPDKNVFHLDSGKTCKINNAWVENDWTYECVNNHAVVTKDTSLQFVIDREYIANTTLSDLLYFEKNGSNGSIESGLDFNYSGEDTLILNVRRNHKILETIKFYKKD